MERRRFDAAYYLAGYVIECALKACIAKQTRRFDFPPQRTQNIYTHDLSALLIQAGLQPDLGFEVQADPQFSRYWVIVRAWNEGSRYERPGEAAARDLYEAITDPQHGVLRWLSSRW
jgi:hypothetical protein